MYTPISYNNTVGTPPEARPFSRRPQRRPAGSAACRRRRGCGQSPYEDSGLRKVLLELNLDSRGGIPMSKGNFSESLRQRILVGIIVVGSLGAGPNPHAENPELLGLRPKQGVPSTGWTSHRPAASFLTLNI